MSSELIHKNEKLASMRSISIQANCGRNRLFPPIFIDGIWDDKGNRRAEQRCTSRYVTKKVKRESICNLFINFAQEYIR